MDLLVPPEVGAALATARWENVERLWYMPLVRPTTGPEGTLRRDQLRRWEAIFALPMLRQNFLPLAPVAQHYDVWATAVMGGQHGLGQYVAMHNWPEGRRRYQA